MKSFKTLALFGALTLFHLLGASQVLTENFNSGLPSSWTQSPTATWSLNPNLGTGGSGCAITQDISFTTPTVSLRTPALNLSGITSLTVTFKTALVKSNFIIPNISLYYSNSSGIQFLARWGSGFSGATTYTLDGSTDYAPPLDSVYVNWESCTHTLSVPAGAGPAYLVFDAELINSGYVLLDDLLIAGSGSTLTTQLVQTNVDDSPSVYPNPCVHSKKITIRGAQSADILLSDCQGRSLMFEYASIGDTYEIDLNHLPAGVYYLTAHTTQEGRIYKKIVLE